jgi:hypothetical protein
VGYEDTHLFRQKAAPHLRSFARLAMADRTVLTIRSDPEADSPTEHRPHPIDETFVRAADQLAGRFEPYVHVDYMGMNHVGEYAANEDGFIARLALLDRSRFDGFVASCAGGLVTTSVVKSLKDVCKIQDVPMPQIPGYATRVFARATLMPSKVEHFMHMSAQFSKGIDISQTNRAFVVTLHAKGYTPRIVSLTGAQIYEAFLKHCQVNAGRYETVAKILRATPHAHISVTSTQMAGHKLWITNPLEPGSFVTVYFTQRLTVKKNRSTQHLCVVALDIGAMMQPASNATEDRACECVVCMSTMEGSVWTCGNCRNRMHAHCMDSWKARSNSCPFCRTEID